MELWELLQIEVLLLNFQNVGTIINRSFTIKLSNCGNYYKSKFYC
ncbi:Hypothetical protein G436_2316 [Leptospira interrogans serovar Hardjo str. Norma]|uniref:Uncharacterized protein n=1 Tax=Leptospira interrogans serovar Hardjo str. Norma TaxID=1279460 RepID=A0A0M3TLQ3_LEPIR|nr:Hypothetical protein G436_2316 [Leptospira interrogans serovar Hardjo str. Norma]